jgi:hypothetical protein
VEFDPGIPNPQVDISDIVKIQLYCTVRNHSTIPATCGKKDTPDVIPMGDPGIPNISDIIKIQLYCTVRNSCNLGKDTPRVL